MQDPPLARRPPYTNERGSMKKILLGSALAITFCTPLTAQRVEHSLGAGVALAAGAPTASGPRTGDAPAALSAATFSIPRAEMEETTRGKKLLYGGLIGAAVEPWVEPT
jgi:hypothetical protein